MNFIEMVFSKDTKPHYMVGQRPLDFFAGEALYSRYPKTFSHEHFIQNNGVGNFGFGQEGEFHEQPEALHRYDLTTPYGRKQYEAALLEQARQNWYAKNEAIDDVADNMGLWEEGMPNLHGDYHLLKNNCKDFVRWIDKEYDRLYKLKYQ